MGLHRDNGAIITALKKEYANLEYSVLIAPGEARLGGKASGILVSGYYDILTQVLPAGRKLLIGATNPFRRATLFSRVPKPWEFYTLIASSQWEQASAGSGCIIHEGARVRMSSFGQQCTVGRGAYLDGVLAGEFTSIHSQAVILPGVVLGRGVRVGAKVQINQGVKIGNWCEISPGKIVTKDMKDGEKC